MEARPVKAGSVVIRPQADAYLLYHVDSDELYLVPHSGFFLLQLCDGRNTVRDIATVAEPLLASFGEEACERVLAFLEALADRGIVNGLRG